MFRINYLTEHQAWYKINNKNIAVAVSSGTAVVIFPVASLSTILQYKVLKRLSVGPVDVCNPHFTVLLLQLTVLLDPPVQYYSTKCNSDFLCVLLMFETHIFQYYCYS
jgi:hypothetical protein